MEIKQSIRNKLQTQDGGIFSELYELIEGKPLSEAIREVESVFEEIPKTPFHAVIGRDFLQNADRLEKYLSDYHLAITSTFQPTALYCKMNGFSINPDLWYLDTFSYKAYGGLGDTEWICYSDNYNSSICELSGMEDIQKLFDDRPSRYRPSVELELAQTTAEFAIGLRFCELVAAAHEKAKLNYPSLNGLPIIANAHEYDFWQESR